MRILLDTCIIMDAVQNRAPFADDAKEIFRKAAMNSFIGCITAKASTDIYYLTHRCTHSDKDTRVILTKLFALFDVLDTAALDCKKAISSSVADYEDAVMIETAVSNGIDYIVTRNATIYYYYYHQQNHYYHPFHYLVFFMIHPNIIGNSCI